MSPVESNDLISENLVVELVRRHVSGAQRVTNFFTNGWRNVAYEVDKQFILKVPRPPMVSDELVKEAYILGELESLQDFPVPRVLGLGKDTDGISYICITRVPGQPIEQRGRPWPPSVLEDLSRVLHQLHALPVQPLLASGLIDVIDVPKQWKTGLAYWRGHDILTQADLQLLEERFSSGWSRFSRSAHVLLHGDVWPSACFTDPKVGGLTGLIDFGDSYLGPLALEFAHVPDLSDPWPKELLQAYSRMGRVEPDLNEEIMFYRLLNAVRYPGWLEPWAPAPAWPNILNTCRSEIARQLSTSL